MEVTPYLRVMPEVFSILSLHGVDCNEAGAHFVEVVNKLRTCEPNYRLRKVKKDNVWILRDFYPNTQVMFKMTMVYQNSQQQAEYHTKIGHGAKFTAKDFPDAALWVNIKIVPPKLQGKIHVPYEAALKYAMAKVANILIGDSIKPEPYMKYEFKPPRRMMPKGYKVESRVSKRSTHIHNKRNRRRKDVQGDGG